MAIARPPQRPIVPIGTPVEVFSRFSSTWVAGFEISIQVDDGYQVLRLSDRRVLPKAFPTEDLRAQHR